MADRDFKTQDSLEGEVKELFLSGTFANSNNPTLISSKGFESVTYVSAGKYELTLDRTYNKFKSLSAILLDSTAKDLVFQVVSEAVATTKKIVVQTNAEATATSPGTSKFFIKLEVKNTSVEK